MSGIITSYDKLKDSPDLQVVLLKIDPSGNDIKVLNGLIETMPNFGVSISYNAPGAEIGDTANKYAQIGSKAAGLKFGGLNNLKASMKYWASSEADPISISILIFGKDAFGRAWNFYTSCFPNNDIGVEISNAEVLNVLNQAKGLWDQGTETVSDLMVSLGLKDEKQKSDNINKTSMGGLALNPPFWGGGDDETNGTISLKLGTFMNIRNLVVDSFNIEPSQELVMDSSRKSHPMWVRCTLTVSPNRRKSASEVNGWYIGAR